MAEELPSQIHRAPNSPMYAPQRPEPSWERLNSPSMRVWVKNTSETQKHMVIDKYYVGHDLAPGERKEIELLNEEIAVFQSHRLPDRIDFTTGMSKPLHAILIEGIPSMIEEERRMRSGGLRVTDMQDFGR